MPGYLQVLLVVLAIRAHIAIIIAATATIGRSAHVCWTIPSLVIDAAIPAFPLPGRCIT